MGFKVSDEENQSDEQGCNGQSFQGGAFHVGTVWGGPKRESKEKFKKV